jgi:hypothetical protein
MSTMRRIFGALLLGLLTEAVLCGFSSALFRFSYRREPMDDPFSWTGIMIHQPGVAISERFAAAPGGVNFYLIGAVQSVLWACAALLIFWWLAKEGSGKRA